MTSNMFSSFYKDIGIDLGTTKTIIYTKGRGIVINEPSVVAINNKTDQILAVGTEARDMLGKTPEHITAVKPIVNGVISDFEVTEKMLRYFFDKLNEKFSAASLFNWPRVVVGIPFGGTEVEKRAVEDVIHNAGARKVYLVENPVAVAIGARLPINEPTGHLVVDIGGGTTEVAIVSLNGIVVAKSLRVAGNKLNDDIIYYIRDEFKLAIGEQTAEQLKINLGSARDMAGHQEMVVRGRDLSRGLPKEIKVDESEIREAISTSVRAIVETIKGVIEITPPELVSDIMSGSILLSGGTSLLRGLDKLIQDETGIPVKIIEDPLTAVARGTGIILENFNAYKLLLVDLKREQPPV